MRTRLLGKLCVTIVVAAFVHTASIRESVAQESKYSPYASPDHPVRAYWGDQHLHSSWSADAATSGTTVGPEEALRFARGEEVTSTTGQRVRLARPLDWLALSDHSDLMGVITEVKAGNPELMKDSVLEQWREQMNAGGEEAGKAMMDLVRRQSTGTLPPAALDDGLARSVWSKSTAIMERYNEPGRFTAFIAFEWTSNAGGGNNLHRNVIYRDGKDRADQVIPMTTFDSDNPEDLLKWMAMWEKKTGGSLLAIPHNGNISNGRMFPLHTFDGEPLTAEWARARARFEVLYEVTQGKGTGEAHPSLAPNDEFADFEIWDWGNLILVPKEPGMIEAEYARDAFKNGLWLEEKLGVNPFKFGLAGGTDAHNGLTAAEESNFFGKFPTEEPRPLRWDWNAFDFGGRTAKGWRLGASGRTAVWATDNTRTALWDAMKRKEVYASTGPRITVRFFGGFDFSERDALTHDPAAAGYAKGVPMGGDLKSAPAGKTPTFLVAAAKDPLGGNLDRIQVIKGWLDESGDVQEKIYDVVWGDSQSRRRDARGRVPPVGSTVDANRATWTNTIGDAQLIAVWKDPDFNPRLRAFYYARVLEIPTPRWTTYDAVRFGIELPEEVPRALQERAYTSPIWYTP